jgi:hypothetical protein
VLLNTSCIWVCIFFSTLGKFSALISLNVCFMPLVCILFHFSIPQIHKFALLSMSQKSGSLCYLGEIYLYFDFLFLIITDLSYVAFNVHTNAFGINYIIFKTMFTGFWLLLLCPFSYPLDCLIFKFNLTFIYWVSCECLFIFFLLSPSTKLENRRVQEVLPSGGVGNSGKGRL